jgi:hypothetical protein
VLHLRGCFAANVLRSSSIFDLRRSSIFAEFSANDRRTFGEKLGECSTNVRRTFVEHSSNVRRKVGELRMFGERSAKKMLRRSTNTD